MIIRDETASDIDEIAGVTAEAFRTLAVSNHTEQFIIAALRAANAFSVSLVAEIDDRVIGPIALSPVTISDGTQKWYGLGPVSVLPEYQHHGIGKALILEGLSRLKDLKAKGCCLVGHPDGTDAPKETTLKLPESPAADGPPKFIWLPRMLERR